MKGKTAKNEREYLHELKIGKNFLNKIQKYRPQRNQLINPTILKLKSLRASKGIINRGKRKVTKWSYICNTCKRQNIPIRIQRSPTNRQQISKKKTIHRKMGKHLRKNGIQMANGPYESGKSKLKPQ